MDFMIEVAELGSKHLLRCAKLKDSEPFKAQQFSLVAKGESVYCFWEGPAGGADGRKSEAGIEILKVLNEEPGSSLSAKRIGEAIGKSQQAAGGVLVRLEKEKRVSRAKGNVAGRSMWLYSITEHGIEGLRQVEAGEIDLL